MWIKCLKSADCLFFSVTERFVCFLSSLRVDDDLRLVGSCRATVLTASSFLCEEVLKSWRVRMSYVTRFTCLLQFVQNNTHTQLTHLLNTQTGSCRPSVRMFISHFFPAEYFHYFRTPTGVRWWNIQIILNALYNTKEMLHLTFCIMYEQVMKMARGSVRR